MSSADTGGEIRHRHLSTIERHRKIPKISEPSPGKITVLYCLFDIHEPIRSRSPERQTSGRHTPVQADRDELAPFSSIPSHGISSSNGRQETPISIARLNTDRKGKRKAVEVDVSEPSQDREEAESHLGAGKSVLGRRTPISATPNEEFPRQGRSTHPRNRTLVESIRAHLGENSAEGGLDPFAEDPSAGLPALRQSSSRGGRGPPFAKSSEGICQGTHLSGGQGQIFTEDMSTDGLNPHSEDGVGGWLRTDPDSNNPMAKPEIFYIPRPTEPVSVIACLMRGF